MLRSCFGLILGIGIISIDPRSGEKRGAGDDAPGGAGSLLGPDSGGPVPADWLSEFKNLLEGMISLVLGGGGKRETLFFGPSGKERKRCPDEKAQKKAGIHGYIG